MDTMFPSFKDGGGLLFMLPALCESCFSRSVSLDPLEASSALNRKPCNMFRCNLSNCRLCSGMLTGKGADFTGKQISVADNLGARPNTRLKGDKRSAVFEGVMLEAKEISVRILDHSGAAARELLIFNSTVRVLCCDSHNPLVRGWYGVVLTCRMLRH